MKLMRLFSQECQIWYGTELKPTCRYLWSIKIVCKVRTSNMVNLYIFWTYIWHTGPRGGAVGWGTALQRRRSRFHWHNPSGRPMALGSTQLQTEMSTRYIPWGEKKSGVYGWQPVPLHICRLSWNLGASNSCYPRGLSRPVMGLFCLLSDTSNEQRFYASVTV